MKIITFKPLECSELYPIGTNIPDTLVYIDRVMEKLGPLIKDRIVNIWCRGSSGAILAALLVSKIGSKTMIHHVKKEGETSHIDGEYIYAGTNKGLNIIIDDFSRSGETLNAIWKVAVKYVYSIDFLIINNRYTHNKWGLDFVPKTLIIDSNHVLPEWKLLKPTIV